MRVGIPAVGALIMSVLDTAIPICPPQQQRSPAAAWSRGIVVAPFHTRYWAAVGRDDARFPTPLWTRHHVTNPEQSHPAGVLPPQRYGTPWYCLAYMATLSPSAVPPPAAA